MPSLQPDKIVITSFQSGASQYEKTSTAGAGRFVSGFSVTDDPNYIIPFPDSVRDDAVQGVAVQELIKWAVEANPWNPDRFFYGGDHIYRVVLGSPAPNNWVAQHTINSQYDPDGQGLVVYDGSLYFAAAKTIGIGDITFPFTGYNDDYFSNGILYTGTISVPTGYDLDVANGATVTGSTYNIPVAVSEAAADSWVLNPGSPVAFSLKDTQKSIQFNIMLKGTGNWQVIVHDSLNNQVAEKGIDNSNLPASGIVTFTFDTPWSPLPDEEYHIHIISTVGDGFIECGTPNDFSTVRGATFFGILIYDGDCHPMTVFAGKMITGNGRYLSSFDGAVYDPNAVAFDPGWTVRSLSQDGEYLVAAAWRGNDVNRVQEGRLYYWDGVATNYNFMRRVSIGMPQAIRNYKSSLYVLAGDKANLLLGTEPMHQVYSWQFLDRNGYLKTCCSPLGEYQDLMALGLACDTNDDAFPKGIYLYGSTNEALPEAMIHAWVPSTVSSPTDNFQIGMVKGFGNEFCFSWYDGVRYGVDIVRLTNPPISNCSWESLIFDGGNIAAEKLLLDITITHTPLTTGDSITPKWKKNRAATFTSGTTNSTVGSTKTSFSVHERFFELEYGLDAVFSSYVKITSILLQYRLLPQEVQK